MLDKLNPFVRYARRQIIRSTRSFCIALDHRLFYCQTGEFSLCLDDRQSLRLLPGSAVYIPAALPYRIEAANSRTFALVFNFDLTSDFSIHRESLHTIPLDEFDGVFPYREIPLPGFEVPLLAADIKATEGVLVRAAQLFDDTEMPYRREMASAYMKTALLQLLSDRSAAKSPAVRLACEYIRKNFSHELTNEKLARMVGYHPNYLHRLFRQELGVGLREYIVSFRIREARRMLSEQNSSVVDIAISCGFGNVSYFSQCFRRHVGMTPREFRRRGMLP